MREEAREIHLGSAGVHLGLPACAVCGRQDETVRYVSYPFVFSIVVLTFRRSFSGWWCRKHRDLRLLLASLITTTFGWLGVPFGLIFTPIALFKLARGGDQPAKANASMLGQLAEHRLARGDAEGAIRCLEASLRIREDAITSARLRELCRTGSLPEEDHRRQLLCIIAAIFGAGLLGIVVGILEFLTAWGSSALLGGETNLYVGVLSWTPLIGAGFLTGLILSRLVEWAVTQTREPPLALGITIAVVSAALALYGVPTGQAMGNYVYMLLSGMAFEPMLDALRTAGAVLTKGGMWWMVDTVVAGDTFAYIYMLILMVCVLYYASTSIAAAVSTVRWKQQISAARSPIGGKPTGMLTPGWFALLAVGLGAAAVFGLFRQHATVDYFQAIAHNATAVELWEQGATDGALEELQQAIFLKPSFAIAHSNLGWLHYNLGDLDQAAEEFQEAIRLEPDGADHHVGFGFCCLSQGDYDAAADAFVAALRLNPDSAGAHSGLGWVHFHLGDLEQATEEFQEVIRLEPNAADPHEGLGFCSLLQGDHDAAADAFATALKLNPDSAAAHSGLGHLHFAQNHLDEARQELELSIDLDPQDPAVHMYLGWTYMRCAQFEKAIEQFLAASDLQPEWGVPHAFLAWIYYQLNRLDEMESEIAQALALHDGDASAHTMLAYVYLELRRFEQAEAQFMKAIELTPEDAGIYTSLAQTYSAQRKFDLALEMCDDASELDPNDADILLARADIYTEQEDLDQALAHLERALELAPEDSDVHSNLSFVYYHRGQFPDALREAQEAIRLQPYSSFGHQSLAFAYYALGETDRALAAARRAVELRPKHDTPHYVLGLCHLDRAEKEKAAAAFSTFLDLYWDRAYRREYRMKAEAYLAQLR
jgi:tetratricopeptide (TPR) repeat protein